MCNALYPSFTVLLVDDEPAWLRSIGIILERSAGIGNVIQCHDSREVMDILAGRDVGLVLLDLTMPHVSGEQLLSLIGEQHPETAVIMLSGMNQIETAVQCMKLGAFDYFVKTVEEGRLISGVLRAVRMLELQRENRHMKSRFLSDSLEFPEAFSAIAAVSKSMRSIFLYLESVAQSSQPVLITGESGVGKELVARALHTLSRCSGQLVAVNVAGLDDTVFADTLYGHVRGAFTGATEPRRGMIEQAANGTLFLDEIGDLSPTSQVKLLRLLQEGEYFQLGSDRPKRTKLRVAAATNQDLTARQESGAFRKDLYYRLCTHHIHIPPLRERKEDIPLLLDHLLEEAAVSMGRTKPSFPKELPVLLANYNFPGNVRELRSMIYDALSRHSGGVLSMEAFRVAVGPRSCAAEKATTEATGAGNPFSGVDPLPSMDQALECLVAEAMRRAHGNQTMASRLLGISQPALSKRLKRSRA